MEQQRALLAHITAVHPGCMKCGSCSFVSTRPCVLQYHIRKCHTCLYYKPCPKEGGDKVPKGNQPLARRLTTAHDGKQMQCPANGCPYTTPSLDCLATHRDLHDVCRGCEKAIPVPARRTPRLSIRVHHLAICTSPPEYMKIREAFTTITGRTRFECAVTPEYAGVRVLNAVPISVTQARGATLSLRAQMRPHLWRSCS